MDTMNIAKNDSKTQSSQQDRQRGQIITSTAIGLLKLKFTPQQVAYLIRRKKARAAKRQQANGVRNG